MGGRLPCLCGPIFATTSVFASISGVTGVGTAPRWAFAAGGAAVLAAAAGAAGESPLRENASTPTPTTATRITPRSRGFNPFPGDGVSGTRGGWPFDADFLPINDHSSVFTDFRGLGYSARSYASIRAPPSPAARRTGDRAPRPNGAAAARGRTPGRACARSVAGAGRGGADR